MRNVIKRLFLSVCALCGLLFGGSDLYQFLSPEEMEKAARQAAECYFFPDQCQNTGKTHNIHQPTVNSGGVFVQKRVRNFFPDETPEDIVRTKEHLFIAYDDYFTHQIYQYKKHQNRWDLEKSYLIEDSICTKPAVYKNYLALFCRDQKRLYLLDTDTNQSKYIQLSEYISNLLWHKDHLIASAPGPHFTWFDTGLKIEESFKYRYEAFPIQVTKNVSRDDLKQANVYLKKQGDILLALSRYYAMLIHADTRRVLFSEAVFYPMGLDRNNTTHSFNSWSSYFSNKAHYGMIVKPDDFWLENVGIKHYVNILMMDRLIIWQWPREKGFITNILILDYDKNGTKTDKNITKLISPKYVGTLRTDTESPTGLFYTSKGFQCLRYDRSLLYSFLCGYANLPDLTIKTFYKDPRGDKLFVYTSNEETKAYHTKIGEVEIYTDRNATRLRYRHQINRPRGYLNAYIQDGKEAYALFKNRLVRIRSHRIAKEIMTKVTYPWGMKRCNGNIVVYGTAEGYALDLFDEDLQRILSKYNEVALKDIACSKKSIILATENAVITAPNLKEKGKVVEDLSGFLDDCMVVGFVKKTPFYVSSKGKRYTLHVLDRKHSRIELPFFATEAEVSGSYIALGHKNQIALIDYSNTLKQTALFKGELLGWYKGRIVYSRNNAIYTYDPKAKKSEKLMAFDLRKWQGKVMKHYISKGKLIFVMSDCYRIIIDLNTQKITVDTLKLPKG